MADNKFLDQQGLQVLWNQIKLKFGSAEDVNAIKLQIIELDGALSDLSDAIATKASKQELNTAIEAVNASIDALESSLSGNYYTKEESEAAIKTAVDAAIDALIDGAPEALDTLKEIAEEIQGQEGVILAMQREIDKNTADIAELAQASVPEYDETSQSFFANGQAIRIREGANNTLDVIYHLGMQEQIMNIPANARFYGGGMGRGKNVEYPGTSIIMESGTARVIYGGGRNNCTVGHASIVVNGGKLTEGVVGGGAGDNNTPAEGGAGNVASAAIVVNGGDIMMVYGGGQNYTNVGNTKIDIYAGEIDYLTTGGSNGSTGAGEVNVYGGTVDVWQVVNRGTLENSVITLNGGTINKLYCVGETEDASVTGHVSYSTVNIEHGSVNVLRMGNTATGGHATSGVVKGSYREGIVLSDPDNVLATFNKIADTELEAMTTQDILDICQ